MIVIAHNDQTKWAMLLFLRERGVQLHRSEDFQAIGRLVRDERGEPKLIGVVAYNGFCGNVCQMHCAGDGNWISRDFIKAGFEYPFVQLGLGAILAPVPANNSRALKMDVHFGFEEVARVRDGWEKGVDIVLLELRRENCRWLQAGGPVLREHPAVSQGAVVH